MKPQALLAVRSKHPIRRREGRVLAIMLPGMLAGMSQERARFQDNRVRARPAASGLKLEITETIVMEDEQHAIGVLRQAMLRGCLLRPAPCGGCPATEVGTRYERSEARNRYPVIDSADILGPGRWAEGAPFRCLCGVVASSPSALTNLHTKIVRSTEAHSTRRLLS